MEEKKGLFAKAERKNIPLKIALIGPSGSGKTFSALTIATGMGGIIGVLDSENKRALHYADKFDYLHLPFLAPFSPERYISAIKKAQEENITCLIIDSASHEWFGPGGCLEIHGALTGNSYTNWSKVTPRHNAFIQAIVDSPIDIITTMRGKDEYVLQERNGKQVPEKVGVGAVQRDGIEYEHTCSFLLDQQMHCATIMKDTTGIFDGKGAIIFTQEHGKLLQAWSAGKEMKNA